MTGADQSTVAHPASAWWLWRLVFPLVGAGGLGLVRIAVGWLAGLPAVPLPGWLRLLADLPDPVTLLVAAGVGAVAGLGLALYAQYDSLTVTVSDHEVSLTRRDASTTLARATVGTVFVDGKHLVVLGRQTEELARQPCDLDTGALAEAFTGHGFPWRAGGDPYRDDYRRWVPDAPDLPAGAGAVLAAREKALAKDDQDDAADLRAELAKLGVVVRDEKTRQYWRLVSGNRGGNGG